MTNETGIQRPEFAQIALHAAIGDRRTGALVAADGTLDWFCVLEFDGRPVFGALLDPEAGGFCRFEPRAAGFGRQRYVPGTVTVVTTWADAAGNTLAELTDIMAWPQNNRAANTQGQRVIARRLRAYQEPGLFAEEIDSRRNIFLGNTPLLFAHVEYSRAAAALHAARGRVTPSANPPNP